MTKFSICTKEVGRESQTSARLTLVVLECCDTLRARAKKKTSKTRWESNLSTSHMIHVFRCQQSKTSSSSRAAALFGHANENWNQISSHTSVRPRLNEFFFQWWFALKNVLDIICEQARITYVFYFSLSVHAHLNWFFFLGVCHLHYFPILGMCIVHLPRGAIYPLNHKLCGNFRNLFFFSILRIHLHSLPLFRARMELSHAKMKNFARSNSVFFPTEVSRVFFVKNNLLQKEEKRKERKSFRREKRVNG